MRYRFNIARDAEPGFDSTNPGSLACQLVYQPGFDLTAFQLVYQLAWSQIN